MPDDLLRVEDLNITVGGVSFGRRRRARGAGGVPAVQGVSFTIRRGEAVGFVGESGSGKTLTCRAALGVLAPGCTVSSGEIDFDGTSLVDLPRRRWDGLRGTRIGAVFQDPGSYLNPSHTVGRQLAEQFRIKVGHRRREARQAAIALLGTLGLHQPELVYHQYPHELSGGMLQRVVLAIAVAGEPDLLVADEATTALDVTVQAEVLEALDLLRAERGLAILAVSHDLAVIAQLCDRILVFYAGEIVEAGPTADVLANPRHPYTAALLRVASVGDWRRRELDVIDGAAPPVGARITGCRFADRCAFVTDACRAAPVELRAAVPGAPAGAPGGERFARCARLGEIELTPRVPERAGAPT
ncbi:peptide ABC transporter ATP-binding protein [Frankia sp. CcI49]|uniref:ABC transporter ATP-binding protein n=1 Tax=unclassified Frankia TaxID=2632575 RepID=UPI0006CA5BF5|nr:MULTISPECIES: ABC transporter ATP-binding protein [unclassified Frankia]ONH54093.1 peptide ABC transporter ATP-binding protein [Frankia sp. CcI49]